MKDGSKENKKIKDVILFPEGIHLDDIIYAMQQVMAGIITGDIIKQEESKK